MFYIILWQNIHPLRVELLRRYIPLMHQLKTFPSMVYSALEASFYFQNTDAQLHGISIRLLFKFTVQNRPSRMYIWVLGGGRTASINYGCQHANCAKLLLSMLFARWQTFNIANVSGSTDNKDIGHRDTGTHGRRRWWALPADAELRNCNCDIDNNAIK